MQLGELTVYFPDGLTPEEITSENTLAAIRAYDSEKMVQVEMNMLFENMRSFMMEVGEQTMLEIYLSAVVNEISGVDGIAIEYTPEHQGMAMVRTSYLDNCIGRGAAFLLDGDTWYVVLVWGGETEADGMELLNEALGYAE